MILNDLPWKWTEIVLLFLKLHSRTAFWTLVDCEGYSISSKGFLPTMVAIMVIWVKFTHSSLLVHWFLKCWCSLLPSPIWLLCTWSECYYYSYISHDFWDVVKKWLVSLTPHPFEESLLLGFSPPWLLWFWGVNTLPFLMFTLLGTPGQQRTSKIVPLLFNVL